MADWDAELYRRFEAERTRPAADLLARVDLTTPGLVVDLGCGPGNSTELLARRFPHASITGVDTSAAMLSAARERLPRCRFEEADIVTWRPASPPDLLFANASLQWVANHAALLPRLLGLLAPGGVLAVQMPDNREEPTHRAMRSLAAEPPFASRIGTAGDRTALLSAAGYYDLLASLAATADIWLTTYHHPMPSARAIVSWVRSTGLRPFLDPLPPGEQAEFLARYEALIEAAYPERRDGQRLLAFPRLFLVVRRRDVAGAGAT